MRRLFLIGTLAVTAIVLAAVGLSQEPSSGEQNPQPPGPRSFMNMTPEQRAALTRAFLGLAPPPDKAMVARGAPLFERNCAFCHGPHARGAEGPDLITSDEVLTDSRGEKLVPFLKAGRPAKGMPSFATMTDEQLTDISEFLHQQVEDVANRGTYHLLNIVVGDPAKGHAYVNAHCMQCHTPQTFAHIAGKFRTPDRLQGGWIWPERYGHPSLAVTAVVTLPDGRTISGTVIQVSDFCITLVNSGGKTHSIVRGPSVSVRLKDPLAAHEAIIMHLRNDDMHNVTAYLETLK
jgi:cytochrome c oxidase cbb3-type subunit III